MYALLNVAFALLAGLLMTRIFSRWRLPDVTASTPLSDRISRDLKKRGFTFVGTTIVYSLLQSAGLVDDHLKGCGWHASCRPPE